MVLIVIARLTSRNSNNEDFFIGSRKSPWFIVAFGMIGASLSGVTFISIPGFVGDNQFSYMQMVLGYLFGYLVIAHVLMPMYYRLKLTSIYQYLEQRFGHSSYKTGSAFFLISRIIGASFRLFLVAIVLQKFLMTPLGVPFWVTVAVTIILIWIYTFQGGIKTIIWTDTIQTASMLLALFATIYVLSSSMDWSLGEMINNVYESKLSKAFFFDGGWGDPKNFFKQFFAGMFITIVMTGLDQDMMQKNLSCPSIKDAQKNMHTFAVILIFINLFFLVMGALLFMYMEQNGLALPTRMVGTEAKVATDLIFPTIALENIGGWLGIIFLIGLIAAAYSSADSALTALTTAFCIDFLNFENKSRAEGEKKSLRRLVHVGFSLVLFFVILAFWWINDQAVIASLFTAAGYTYGPLLGLYAFGFFTKRQVRDRLVPVVAIISPILTYLIQANSEWLLNGYKFGFEIVILNGLLTYIGLYLLSLGDFDKVTTSTSTT